MGGCRLEGKGWSTMGERGKGGEKWGAATVRRGLAAAAFGVEEIFRVFGV